MSACSTSIDTLRIAIITLVFTDPSAHVAPARVVIFSLTELIPRLGHSRQPGDREGLRKLRISLSFFGHSGLYSTPSLRDYLEGQGENERGRV